LDIPDSNKYAMFTKHPYAYLHYG